MSRAFGADSVVLSGEKDTGVIESVDKISLKWGGKFTATYEKSGQKVMRDWKSKGGKIAHLTMYGLPVQKILPEIQAATVKIPLLVVIGAEKVPREVYELADWNVSVTTQPHSEVAALAVFLHMFQEGEELEKSFEGAELRINPSPRGKNISKT